METPTQSLRMADRAEPEDLQVPAHNMAQGTAESARVFISYASADKPVADDVCAALESVGILCWIAPRDVKPGALYADAIVRAITGAKALVLVLSESSIASSHIGKEVERASSKKRPIIALRIDAAPLTPALEYFLKRIPMDRCFGQPVGIPPMPKVSDAIRDPESVGAGGTPPHRAAAGTPKSRQNRRLLKMGLAVAALVVIAVILIKFLASRRIADEPPPSTAARAMSEKSIAVLPFTDMSEKKDQEYFADGMAEEILDVLAKIPGLTVIGRTSSFQFKGKNADLRTIGTMLNAAYVLEGTVRKFGDQVRITAQLVNARTGAREWSETYDRHIGDVLRLQDAIGSAVARELQLTVAPDYVNSRSTPKNAEVYDLYLRGRHAYDRHENGGLDEAATLFQRALDLDPTFVDADVWLAWTRVLQGQFGYLAPTAAFEQGRGAAASALKLDPRSAEAHAVLGLIHTAYDWDWAAAERELQQATTLAPGNVNVLFVEAMLSQTLGHCGRCV